MTPNSDKAGKRVTKRLNLEMKVGIFFVACFLLIGIISLKLGNYALGEARGYQLSAVFNTAAGINDETPVLMAGMRVGQVTDMRLELGKARLFFKVKEGTEVPDDSVISVASRGFLGSKYLEITPGQSKSILKPGDSFDNASMAGELDALTSQAGDIAGDIKAITANLRRVFGGEEGEEGIRDIFLSLQEISMRLAETLEDNQKRMSMIAINIEKMTANVAAMSEENRQAIRDAITVMPLIANNLNVIAQNIATITTDNNEELNAAVRGLAESSTQLRDAMAHIASITRKIDEGQGTIGSLVNDTETIDQLSETLDSVNEFVGRVRRIQTHVEYRGEWWMEEGDLKSYLTLRLQPRLDKWYAISLIDDPFGRISTTTTYTRTTTDPGGPNEETVRELEKKRVKTDTFKLSAQIAKRWHMLVLRGGILESTGGAGMDALFFDDHLKLSVEAFDFGNDDNPRLKANMDFMFLDHFFVTFGADDIIHQSVLDGDMDPQWFAGGGIAFRDEDISALFTKLPLPDF